MPPTATPAARDEFRFALPPSLGTAVTERASRLEKVLSRELGKTVKVAVSANYETLAKDLLAGRSDAAWAPPFVCARVEAMGVRVLARGVRNGLSTYRAALVCRAGENLTLNNLAGKSALWVDRDSVAGYLLPMAFLRANGLEPPKLFFSQEFSGSYKTAAEGVLAGKADVTSVFAPPGASAKHDQTGIDEILPGQRDKFSIIALTDESPNDGVVVSMGVAPEQSATLEKVMMSLRDSTDGVMLLKELFNAERFEAAPRLGYRALYRVALASL